MRALNPSATSGGGAMGIDRLPAAHELAKGRLVELLPDYELPAGQPVYTG
jgi:hypothetical protein